MLIPLLIILAANTPVLNPLYPTQPPTWETLIPWVVGFLGLLVSSMLWYITNQQNKKIEALTEVVTKLQSAVYLSHRVELLRMAADPALHAAIRAQAESQIREIDLATQK